MNEIRVYQNNPEIKPSIVNNVCSKDPIYLDVAVSANQNIHLIWQSKWGGLTYQKSIDNAESWRNIQNITNRPVAKPRVFSSGDTVSVFWMSSWFQVRMSIDGGATWGPIRDIYRGGIHHLLRAGSKLYDIMKESDSVTFSKSSDFGATWSPRTRLDPADEYGLNLKSISTAINDGNIYIGWINGNSVAFISSTDSGENWSDARKIDLVRYTNGISMYDKLRRQEIAANDDMLLLVYDFAGLNYVTNARNEATWTPGYRLAKRAYWGFTGPIRTTNGFYFFWTDTRNQKSKWWSNIPFYFIITWDAETDWQNNDLYYAIVGKDKALRTGRLTPPFSYVSLFEKPIACDQLGNKVIVFWCGKRKIGKSPDESEYPFEISFRILG
jgi:hypothetical protein